MLAVLHQPAPEAVKPPNVYAPATETQPPLMLSPGSGDAGGVGGGLGGCGAAHAMLTVEIAHEPVQMAVVHPWSPIGGVVEVAEIRA